MKALYLILILLLAGCKGHQEEHKIVENKQTLGIAYNVLIDTSDNYEVFSADLEGRKLRNITNLPGVEWTYYAEGKDLYFISDKDTAHRNYFLYKTDALGNEPKKIFDQRLSDSWMDSRKKGNELIIKPHRTVDTAFYVIDTFGKIKQRLVPDLAYFNDPVFSPDGKKIVFRGATKPFRQDTGYLDELYMINEDGTGLKQLTHYPESDTTAQWYNYHAGPPRWHPNEDFISYNSKQKGKYALFAVSPDGERSWELYTNDTLSLGWHDWSPDGKWLAVGFSDLDQEQFGILMVNWETKKARVITDTLYKYQQAPVFVERNQ